MLDMDYIGYHQLHTVHITIEMRYTYLEWSGGVANMPYLLLLFTTSTTCKSRGTMIEMLASNWAAQDRSYRGPPVFNAQHTTTVPGDNRGMGR